MTNQPTQLICIAGLRATGKTTVGNLLLSHLGAGAVLICPDQIILKLLNDLEPEHLKRSVITDKDIEQTPELPQTAIAIMALKAAHLLKKGFSVVVPSAFIGEPGRLNFEGLIPKYKLNAQFHAFLLEADFSVREEHSNKRLQDVATGQIAFNNASATRAKKEEAFIGEFTPAWQRINANPPKTAEDILSEILQKLALPSVSPALAIRHG